MTTETGGAPSQSLEMGRVSVYAEAVDDYLRAVGDELPIYRQTGLAPPLYGAASSLGLLLKTLDLPPGAIHSLQEVDTLAPLVMGRICGPSPPLSALANAPGCNSSPRPAPGGGARAHLP